MRTPRIGEGPALAIRLRGVREIAFLHIVSAHLDEKDTVGNSGLFFVLIPFYKRMMQES